YELAERCAYFTAWLDVSTPFTHIEEASSDITRIVIHTGRTLMSGHALYDALSDEFGIVCEMADDENVVLIPSVLNPASDFDALQSAVLKLSARAHKRPVRVSVAAPPEPVFRMDMREAYFSDREYVSPASSKGRISCETLTKYPPGIPYLMPGQEIGEYEAAIMARQGVGKVSVVK
ncbi:MAG: hypothetical protein IIY69_07700, partial [Clostridia bacterium]|nr:hypothetical protein [Clostridia bacterium]